MRWFYCGGTAALTACTLLTPLADYTSGPSAPDAAADTATATATSDASPPFSCATAATGTTRLCTDFGGARVDEGWSGIETQFDPGYLDASTAEFLSPPRGLEVHVQVAVPENSGSATTRLVRTVGETPAHARLSFAVKTSPPALLAAEKNFVSIGELLCGKGATFDGVWLHFRPGSDGVARLHALTSNGAIKTPLQPFPTDRWVRVVLDVRWVENKRVKYTVSFDGVEAGAGESIMPVCATTADLRAVVGLSGDVPSSAFFDDVLLDVE